MRSFLPLFSLLAALIVGLFLMKETPRQLASQEIGPSKLAVLVIFDQMRGDYLEKWQNYFSPHGFKRLETQGAWFQDCQYPYASTTTGPGHASIMTGCSGSKHGIINNNWYDRSAGKEVYSAGSERYSFIPARPSASAGADAKASSSSKPKPVGNPDKLLSESLADVLLATRPGSKVFGVSLKDRSAIFPTGKRPTGAFWFDGRFGTSTYYTDTLPAWVQAFNTSGEAEKYFNKTWERFRPDLDYTAIVGPDHGLGEGQGVGQGVVFPHPMHGGKPDKLGKEYYEALANSPYGNDLLLAFAKQCIIAEQLGQRDETDFFAISFSSNDLIGHTWGPDSHEVFDVTLRSDALMADFLNFLDAKVGAGRYTLVMTADHGVCPNPEVSASRGLDAQRIPKKKLEEAINQHLSSLYGAEKDPSGKPLNWLESLELPNVYLNRSLIRSKGLNQQEVAKKLAEWLPSVNGVQRVFTATELMTPRPEDPLFEQCRASFYPERSGDLFLVTKPFYLVDSYNTGTSHGTPHSYDTHSVFVAFGPGIPGGPRSERVHPQHAAPILSAALRLRYPKDCQYDLPRTLFKP